MAKSKPLQDREPGFNSLPPVDSDRQAPTDQIDDIVGGIMDEIQKDATGTKPGETDAANGTQDKPDTNAAD
ncbi:hypothetical protein AWM70_11000 [Paenibacillus yonginensis]|uniref:Uncharacterized protein n=1 Tax=Paenibacillus yonginensis TaxID=1462996 RepID=A0A1B1N0U8_9BACL|nr:hypothetical protein [Paenibacillus yonginensis]ANS75064.1 hypothetical protein AWM70_11000 [Paenibacillus yonginensis]